MSQKNVLGPDAIINNQLYYAIIVFTGWLLNIISKYLQILMNVDVSELWFS